MQLRTCSAVLLLLSQYYMVDGHPSKSPVRFERDANRHQGPDRPLHLTSHLQLYTLHGRTNGNNDEKEFPCPLEGDIAPCTCSVTEASQLQLDCSAVESDEQLATVFEANFPVKNFYLFNISRNDNIQSLGNILNGITFEKVHLYFNYHLQSISADFLLDSTETLTYLSLYRADLTESTFPFDTLQLYTKLETLDLTYNDRLESIPKLSSSSLKYIYFYGSKIVNLIPGTFDAVPLLQEVEFYYNNISSLEIGTMQLTTQLTRLGLDSCKIERIAPGAFRLAKDIDSTDVEFSFFLYGNRLTELPSGSIPLPDRPTVLDLSRNDLASLAPGTFVLPKTTKNLAVELILNDNQLTVLDEEVFGEVFPFVTSTSLYYNPLECGCDIAWLVTNPDYFSKVDIYSTCTSGTHVIDLNPADYEIFC